MKAPIQSAMKGLHKYLGEALAERRDDVASALDTTESDERILELARALAALAEASTKYHMP